MTTLKFIVQPEESGRQVWQILRKHGVSVQLMKRLKREEMGLGPHRAILISTLLFASCHIYEGPWGFLNAALSGIVLAYVFLRFRSLHGIAIAHALYNIVVYALGAL